MPTVIATHDVKDTAHWLASPKRAEIWPFRFQRGERVRMRGAGGRWAGQLTPPVCSRIRSR